MRILSIFLLLLSGIVSSFGQPTLTRSIIPLIGEKYTSTDCDTNGVQPGAKGENITWNFANLKKLTSEGSTETLEIVAPSSGVNSELFPGANYAYASTNDLAENAYSYYKSSSTKIERLGTGFTGGFEKLKDFELVAKFPFTYQDEFSDTFSGELNTTLDGESFSLNRGATIEVMSDGYGTLVLPQGTFSNVLRLVAKQVIGDTLPPPIPGFPGGLILTETTTYLWQNNEYKFPLLSISFVKSTQNIAGQTQVINAKVVALFDAEPNTQTLSEPTLASPPDNAQNLTLPVTLQWEASALSKASKSIDKFQQSITYTLLVSDNVNFPDNATLKTYEIQTTSKEISDLTPGETYFWKVNASAGAVSSDWSSTRTFSIKANKPSKPNLSSPPNDSKDISSSTVNLSWVSDESVVKTRLNIKGTVEKDIFVENASNYTINDLQNKTVYFWKIKTYNAAGDSSDWSEEWKFTTDEPSSVVDKSTNFNFITISPNPAIDLIDINFDIEYSDNLTLNIYFLDGRLAYSKDLGRIDSGSFSSKININSLSRGAYLLSIEGKITKVTDTFIVK